MSDTLSEASVDELLSAVRAGDSVAGGGEARTSKREVKVYDFKRPDKFSLDQIRTMQTMHETFARLSTTTLSATLRSMAHVRVSSVDQLTYEEFIRSIPCPTTLGIVGMDPLKGQALLEIDPGLSFAIIDRLFGGQGESVRIDRELTDIEHSVMEGIVVRLLGNLRESWSQMLDLTPRLVQIETYPMFAQIVAPQEMIILVSLEATIGETTGMMNLCFPFLTIEPMVPKLSAHYWYSSKRPPASAEATQALLGRLEGLDISAELLIEGERLSLRDIGALKKGSLLRLPGHEKGEASFRMGGRTLFTMRELPRKWGTAPIYEMIGEPPEDGLPLLEPSEERGGSPELEAAVRGALGELRSSIGESLSGLASGLAALSRKQDELGDQLALGPAEGESLATARFQERKRPFGFLRGVDHARALSLFMQEHPQTIALILSYVEPQAASLILGSLDPELQPEVARRIATMDRTAPEVLREVERILEKKLSMLSSEEHTAAGGMGSIVDILNMADRSTEKRVVESLEKSDPALAEEIKKRMFVFEDIVLLDRKAAVALLQRTDGELLIRAMKAAPNEVKAFIWDCLPEKEAQRLKSRSDEIGSVRLSEVDAAQQKIVATIREMEENGELFLARPGESVE